MRLSIVVPVYNEEKNIPEFHRRIAPILRSLGTYEIISALDPSPELIREMVAAVVYLGMKLGGFPFPMGNPTIVIWVLFMGGVQFLSMVILGEYIGRIYDEVKERPRFIVDRKVGIEP